MSSRALRSMRCATLIRRSMSLRSVASSADSPYCRLALIWSSMSTASSFASSGVMPGSIVPSAHALLRPACGLPGPSCRLQLPRHTSSDTSVSASTSPESSSSSSTSVRQCGAPCASSTDSSFDFTGRSQPARRIRLLSGPPPSRVTRSCFLRSRVTYPVTTPVFPCVSRSSGVSTLGKWIRTRSPGLNAASSIDSGMTAVCIPVLNLRPSSAAYFPSSDVLV